MATGGSICSESSGYATMHCCKELLKRLEPIKKELKDPSWQELILTAYQKDVNLCARHMYTISKNNTLKPYPIYGVAIAEVEIDLLTGQHIIRRVDLMQDTGISLNPEIDVGQVEGAFMMGIGFWTSEELIYNAKTGELTNNRTCVRYQYRVDEHNSNKGVKDIPEDFRVSLRKNAPNPLGFLRSKATGEPPQCMSCVIPVAIRYALNSARAEAGNKDEWYQLDRPFTNERILLNV